MPQNISKSFFSEYQQINSVIWESEKHFWIKIKGYRNSILKYVKGHGRS